MNVCRWCCNEIIDSKYNNFCSDKCYSKDYIIKNKEKRKIYQVEYYKNNINKIKIKNSNYSKNNKEKKNIREVKYREWRKRYDVNYRIIYKEKLKKYNLTYQANNRGKTRINKNNYRAKKRNSGGVLSPNICEYLFLIQQGKCALCNKELPLINIKGGCHVDHIIPVSKGGPNRDDNVQLTHAICNKRKANKLEKIG